MRSAISKVSAYNDADSTRAKHCSLVCLPCCPPSLGEARQHMLLKEGSWQGQAALKHHAAIFECLLKLSFHGQTQRRCALCMYWRQSTSSLDAQ